MPNITDAVGSGARNANHDVAMVQFMLKVLKGARGSSYFGAPYTNRYGGDTARALTEFQADHHLVAHGAIPGAGGGGGAETAGVVRPGSATWAALLAAFGSVDARYRSAHATEGFGLVYVPMEASRLAASLSTIHDAQNLQSEFRLKVVQLVQAFFKKSGIAWSLVPQTGGWRPFAGQAGLVSDASYGESIHQYGYAVDLTVANFTWFTPDLVVRKSPISLSGMEKRLSDQLYVARNLLIQGLKLYSTTKSGDFAHLQNFDDDTLDSVSSLMALMHAVGPRKMKWTPQFRTPTDYWCDLGLGGEHYFVGTAASIWKQDPAKHISAADLAKALGAKKRTDPKFSASAFLGRAASQLPAQPAASDIKPSDIVAVQKMLRAEFDAAAANWKQWKPVKYPGTERRQPNPAGK